MWSDLAIYQCVLSRMSGDPDGKRGRALQAFTADAGDPRRDDSTILAFLPLVDRGLPNHAHPAQIRKKRKENRRRRKDKVFGVEGVTRRYFPSARLQPFSPMMRRLALTGRPLRPPPPVLCETVKRIIMPSRASQAAHAALADL